MNSLKVAPINIFSDIYNFIFCPMKYSSAAISQSISLQSVVW